MGGVVEFVISSDDFLNIYVIDIHHILTFQTSGDTGPAAFYSIFRSGGHFVHRSGTVLAVLVESHLNNIPMKFE